MYFFGQSNLHQKTDQLGEKLMLSDDLHFAHDLVSEGGDLVHRLVLQQSLAQFG